MTSVLEQKQRPAVERVPEESTEEQTAGALRRMWRRPRHPIRLALLGVAVIVLGIFGYVFAGYALRTHPGAKSLNSAVNTFRAGGSAQDSAGMSYPPPAQGVYELQGQGSERISFPPNAQSDGRIMPASVTYTSSGCWRWHLDFNVAHWEEYDFCATGGRLVQTGNRNSQSWDYGTLSVNNVANFTCPANSVVLRGSLSAGETLTWACSGTNTAVPGRTSAKTVNRIVGVASLSIGRKPVEAVHERQVTTLSGGQQGTVAEDWWFASSSGLPLRVVRDITIHSASPIGTITYYEKGSWQMVSTQPRR
jgi:hypothetical protein